MSRIARLVASAPARAAAGAALSAMAVALPGHPFQVVPSPDGCWLYVSLNSSGPRSLKGSP